MTAANWGVKASAINKKITQFGTLKEFNVIQKQFQAKVKAAKEAEREAKAAVEAAEEAEREAKAVEAAEIKAKKPVITGVNVKEKVIVYDRATFHT